MIHGGKFNKYMFEKIKCLDNIFVFKGVPTGVYSNLFRIELEVDINYFIISIEFFDRPTFSHPLCIFCESIEEMQKLLPLINVKQFENLLLKKQELLINHFVAEEI